MTQEELLEMARDTANHGTHASGEIIYTFYLEQLVAFANLVAAKEREEANAKANASWTLMCKKMVAIEREACAQVCDSFYLSWIDIQGRYEFMGEGASECAGAIRARGEQA